MPCGCELSIHQLSLTPELTVMLYRSIYAGKCRLFDRFAYILEHIAPRKPVFAVYYGCAPVKPGEIACGWIPTGNDPNLPMALTAAVAACIQKTRIKRTRRGSVEYAVLACPDNGFTMISAVSRDCFEALIIFTRRESNDNVTPHMHT